MKYQAILFDLDGTLLPQDLQEVLGAVLKEEVNTLSFLDKSHDDLAEALAAAFWALLHNDGQKTNEERYFETLAERLSVPEESVRFPLEQLLKKDFERIRPFVGENSLAIEAYRQSRAHAQKVAVATNPVFPAETQRFRLSWVGLDYDAFDLVTSYEADRAVKPSREYYLFVCERLGVNPENCLMIGNDESDDMYGAALVGMDSFLVTDCLIGSEKHPYSGKRGTFRELVDYLSSLEVW